MPILIQLISGLTSPLHILEFNYKILNPILKETQMTASPTAIKDNLIDNKSVYFSTPFKFLESVVITRFDDSIQTNYFLIFTILDQKCITLLLFLFLLLNIFIFIYKKQILLSKLNIWEFITDIPFKLFGPIFAQGELNNIQLCFLSVRSRQTNRDVMPSDVLLSVFVFIKICVL